MCQQYTLGTTNTVQALCEIVPKYSQLKHSLKGSFNQGVLLNLFFSYEHFEPLIKERLKTTIIPKLHSLPYLHNLINIGCRTSSLSKSSHYLTIKSEHFSDSHVKNLTVLVT